MVVLRSGRKTNGKSEKGKKTIVAVRSGRETNGSSRSSSIVNKPKYLHGLSREELFARHVQAFAHLQFKRLPSPDPDPNIQLAEEALNFFNQNSPQTYKLLKLHSVTLNHFGHFMLYHINFTAQNTHVAAAPEEMFFTELTNALTVSVRLCISLGPKNSLSGEKLNGCYYCRDYNMVWHPTSGGFVRGADVFYKTVQDICDINQNNAIPDHEKHLPMLKKVYQILEPKTEHENISQQVDDASRYAIEALKVYNKKWNYKLVKPGFVTRVILPTCLLFHINFTAKDIDDATAPETIFFAEMTSTSGVLFPKMCTIVFPKICTKLMPRELLLEDATVDKLKGCYYCHEFNNILHPNGGFVRGGDSLYISEKELKETQLT